MNIDPSTIKQLLQLQLMNQMDLITSGAGPDNNTSNNGFDFAGLLQTMLSEQGGDKFAASGSNAGAALAALSAMGSIGALSQGGGLNMGSLAASPYASSASMSYAKHAAPRSHMGFTAGAAAGKPTSYETVIQQASAAYGVEPSLVKAVIHQESSFNPRAVSSAGAKGLMQLMDDTGNGLGVTDPFDPQQNIHGGTKFLSDLLRKYKGHEGVALAAYNAGPGRVDRLGIRTQADLSDKLHLLPQETQHYIKRVLGLKDQYAAGI